MPRTTSTAGSRKWGESSEAWSTTVEDDLERGWEFIDIGCGNGRTTETLVQKLDVRGKGLGIDLNGHRLPESTLQTVFRENDVLALPNKKQCQFTTLINVVPGLANYAAALALIRKACMICRDFTYVCQANFDCNPYLLRLGLKTHYSDTATTRFQATSADYYRIARTLKAQDLVTDFSIIESGPIVDSSDDAIHPLQTPPDAGPYDAKVHRYKPVDIVFHEPIYRRLQLILTRKPGQLIPISKRLGNFDSQDNVVLSSELVG